MLLALFLTAAASASVDRFDTWRSAEFPVADGFDFAVGDTDGRGSYVDKKTGRAHQGWYVATDFAERYSLGIHPGEDWNGAGGGNTDLGQDVHAVARVAFAEHCGKLWGNVVMIDHVFYENHERREIRSAYVHLDTIAVKVGQVVQRRDVIGTVGRDPDGLYPAHLHLELRWDKSLAATYWPSSNGRGRREGLLSAEQERRIRNAWLDRKATWQGSPLGGGIGLHGWAGDWDLDGPRRLSWGCVVMRNADIARAFPQIPAGTMVVVF